MEHKLYLPSKLLLHNAKMMTKINRLKSKKTPPFKMVAHLRPHISNLKATFVFLRCIFFRPLYDITAKRVKVRASSPCVSSNSTTIHFPRYLFIIIQPNKCAVCCVMLHHTSEKVTWVRASPATKVTLSPTHLRFYFFQPLSVWKKNK